MVNSTPTRQALILTWALFIISRGATQARAIEFHERNLKIRLAIHGEQNPVTASSYGNLGNVYNSQGDYPRAIEFHERSLKIRLAIHGERPAPGHGSLLW